jgi:hypothetical protein
VDQAVGTGGGRLFDAPGVRGAAAAEEEEEEVPLATAEAALGLRRAVSWAWKGSKVTVRVFDRRR